MGGNEKKREHAKSESSAGSKGDEERVAESLDQDADDEAADDGAEAQAPGFYREDGEKVDPEYVEVDGERLEVVRVLRRDLNAFKEGFQFPPLLARLFSSKRSADDWSEAWDFYKLLFVGAVSIGACIVLPTVGVEVYHHGWHITKQTRFFLYACLIGLVVAPPGVLLTMLASEMLFYKRDGSSRKNKAPRYLVFVGSCLLTTVLIGVTHYQRVKKQFRPVDDADRVLAESKETLEKQRQGLARLSSNARDALTGLEKTNVEIQRAKLEVSKTLDTLVLQEAEIMRAAKQREELLKTQEEIQHQQEVVKSVLQGRYVPTRAEVEKDNWINVVIGFAVGFFTNLVTNWLYDRWKERRKRDVIPAPPPTT